jgi:hypothetical protein
MPHQRNTIAAARHNHSPEAYCVQLELAIDKHHAETLQPDNVPAVVCPTFTFTKYLSNRLLMLLTLRL